MLRHVTRRIVEVFLIRIRQGTGYDALKRLTNATTAAWTQTIGYDGFGNITSKTVPPTSAEPAFPGAVSAKNWLAGVSYDLNGNALAVNAFALTYDVENRLATATSGTAVESYLYDESNHRVEKTIGSSDYLYFYGPDGRLLTILQLWAGTTSLVANRMYFGGLLLGSAGPGVWNDVSTMTDRLGTAVTGYPYGTDIGSTSASNDQPDFATYTKDATTGFEYANQRYYSAGLGRFLTVDRSNKNVTLLNPYTWNGFGYGNGDPVNSNDPTGLDVYCTGGTPDGEGILQGVTCYDDGLDNNDGAISGLPVDGTSVTVTATPDVVLYDPSTPDSDLTPAFYAMGFNASASGPPPPAQRGPNEKQFCDALAKKIANIQRDIEESESAISVNPGNLPVFAPGLPPSQSVLGHAQELLKMKANLAAKLALYASQCGGGGPPVVPVRPPKLYQPGEKFPGVSLGVGAGTAVVVGCVLFPEVCLPLAPLAPVLAF